MVNSLAEFMAKLGIEVLLEEDAGTHVAEGVGNGTGHVPAHHLHKQDVEHQQVHDAQELPLEVT